MLGHTAFVSSVCVCVCVSVCDTQLVSKISHKLFRASALKLAHLIGDDKIFKFEEILKKIFLELWPLF